MLVKCPKCLNEMNYVPKPGIMTIKNKLCVYCGRSFKVHSNLKKSRIVSLKNK